MAVTKIVEGPGIIDTIKGAIAGVFMGILLMVVSVPLLGYNEYRAVRIAESLTEGAAITLSLSSAAVDASGEGRLVHTSGDAKTSGSLTDDAFFVTADSLRLRRSVEMYQWKENKTEKKLDDGKKEVTYSYTREWSSQHQDSSKFEEKTGHTNPTIPYDEASWNSPGVTLGAYTLTDGQVSQLANWETLKVDSANAETWIAMQAEGMGHLDNGGLYLGAKPGSPTVGDVKVTFDVIKPGPVSVVSQQVGNTFKPYTTSNGWDVDLVASGTVDAETMFGDAQSGNTMMLWVFRGVGWMMMFIGITALFRPFTAIAEKIPLIGGLLGFGATVVGFLLSSAMSLFIIGVAWVIARPLLGALLLGMSCAAFAGLLVVGVAGGRALKAKMDEDEEAAPA